MTDSRDRYTVVVYKTDRRTKKGERQVHKCDHLDLDKQTLKHLYETTWFAKDGYRFEIFETLVTRRNMMTGREYQERYDTPNYCSPSCEAYWAM